MTKVKPRLKKSRDILIHLGVGTQACPVLSGPTATVRRSYFRRFSTDCLTRPPPKPMAQAIPDSATNGSASMGP